MTVRIPPRPNPARPPATPSEPTKASPQKGSEGLHAVARIDPGLKPRHEQALARHWAPVFFQETHENDPKADFITRCDFDGDWISNNNWQNLESPEADLKPAVYYSCVETDTHYFLTYLDFHPRDWALLNFFDHPKGIPHNSHENDLEGAMVVVQKDGSPFGKLQLVATQAHGNLHLYTNDRRIAKGSNEHLSQSGVALLNGSHPALYVQDRGHGVYAMDEKRLADGSKFPKKGTGVVYRPGFVPREPKSGNDRNVPYELRSTLDELWSRREDIGPGRFLDKPMRYEGRLLGGALDGNDYGVDSAVPPWGWSDGGSKRGDFFLRPAETIAKWIKSPTPISTRYVYNPFLGVQGNK